MKRLHPTIAILAACMGAACSEPESDLPKPGEVPMSRPPSAPNPGTYTGLTTRDNRRPPPSGLNADPANPSGAPGTYIGPNITR
ncbi:MAG: hypothetical protein KIT25_04060 [Enhydrobacter sp.]|nr:MAG: hypothetical protein KIT25_04060 [Enhydrobacter sp.]